MGSDLHDAVVLAGSVDHRAAFHERDRQRLLDVDVLARLAGGDHLDRVPVVGGGDHDGVDVLAIEQDSKILDAGDVAFELRNPGNPLAQTGESRVEPIVGAGQVRLIDIAQGDDLGVGMSEEPSEELAAAVADADKAKPQPIVGSEHPARRHAHRRGRGSRGLDGCLRKGTSIHSL